MNTTAYVIGLHFGTDSVRAIVVNVHTGEEAANAHFLFPRWREKKYCNPAQSLYRQHPLDYIEGIEAVLRNCIAQAGSAITKQIKAIGIDATGSTPVAVDRTGTPLALLQ